MFKWDLSLVPVRACNKGGVVSSKKITLNGLRRPAGYPSFQF